MQNAAKNAAYFRVVNLTDLNLKATVGPATFTVWSVEGGNAAYARVRPRKQEVVIEGDGAKFAEEVEFTPQQAKTAYCLSDGKGIRVIFIDGTADRPSEGKTRVQVVNLTEGTVSVQRPGAADLTTQTRAARFEADAGSLKVVLSGAEESLPAEEATGYTVVLSGSSQKPNVRILADHPKMNIEAGGASPSG
jgi:hypothetical protein